jgi:hypothetical protein
MASSIASRRIPDVRRRLLTILSAISLMLCVAIAALWIRSRQTWDMIQYEGGNAQRTLTSLHGRVQFFDRNGFPRAEPRWGFNSRVNAAGWMIDSMPDRRWYQRLGFDFRYRRFGITGTGGRDLIIMLPYWFLMLLTATPPLLWTARRLRRPPAGTFCRKCGYDLRATPERCPECGTVTRNKDDLELRQSRGIAWQTQAPCLRPRA